ncbi:Nucleotide-binding universal stress protein, UspA family [Actinopolyspora xinjiangensis]|uniref:Nucleotide-binding universal stress protein, UspA family n=1 Tax=Actinopolyspora xinjiangensis TaxID=405564 RepID=A0A1H0QBC0_9ACTN|nr:Nucleotide-binding universal stress protein, UspA family [Actinopolyspora xinjiangensis]
MRQPPELGITAESGELTEGAVPFGLLPSRPPGRRHSRGRTRRARARHRPEPDTSGNYHPSVAEGDSNDQPEPSFEIGKDGLGGIVVGLDGSPASFHAAAWAAGLARRERARLVLVYVEAVGGVAYWSPMGVAVASEAAEGLVEDLKQEIVNHLKWVDIDWDFVHHRGDPAVGLEQVAEQYRADLIVVGRSRRRGGLLGTVPATLVVEAVRPVVVVP